MVSERTIYTCVKYIFRKTRIPSSKTIAKVLTEYYSLRGEILKNRCPYCGRSFKYRRTVKNHMRRRHYIDVWKDVETIVVKLNIGKKGAIKEGA